MTSSPEIYRGLSPSGRMTVRVFAALGFLATSPIVWITPLKGVIWGAVFGVIGVLIGANVGRAIALAYGQKDSIEE